MNNNLDILDSNLGSEERILVQAEKGKRFANYFIDMIVFLILYLAISVVIFILSDAAMEVLEEIDENSIETRLLDHLISMIFTVVYYTIVEGSLKGKTIGKYITKTRVVNLDGSTPNLTTILTRSFARIVPFEAFSFLGDEKTGWHDRWTDTIVIDEKLSSF